MDGDGESQTQSQSQSLLVGVDETLLLEGPSTGPENGIDDSAERENTTVETDVEMQEQETIVQHDDPSEVSESLPSGLEIEMDNAAGAEDTTVRLDESHALQMNSEKDETQEQSQSLLVGVDERLLQDLGQTEEKVPVPDVVEEEETIEDAELPESENEHTEDADMSISDQENNERTTGKNLPLARVKKIMKICLVTEEDEDESTKEQNVREQQVKKKRKGKAVKSVDAKDILITQEAIFLTCAATELFIATVAQQGGRITSGEKKKVMTIEHLKRAVSDSECYEFLQGCLHPSIIIGD